MILKEIYLYPDLVGFPDEVVREFRDQSRSICNYLERAIKPVKFNSDGFKRICFIGSGSPEIRCYINSSKVLIVEVKFDKSEYFSISDHELNGYFKRLIENGINKCGDEYLIPKNELLTALAEFESNGWLNEWQFKKNTFKEYGIECVLDCKLTTSEFSLFLNVSNKSGMIWSDCVLKTVPDEIVFVPKFKDIRIEDEKLIVVDKFGDVTYGVSLHEMGA